MIFFAEINYFIFRGHFSGDEILYKAVGFAALTYVYDFIISHKKTQTEAHKRFKGFPMEDPRDINLLLPRRVVPP